MIDIRDADVLLQHIRKSKNDSEQCIRALLSDTKYRNGVSKIVLERSGNYCYHQAAKIAE